MQLHRNSALPLTQAVNFLNAIHVLEVRPVANAGSLRAIASVQLGDIVIRDFRVRDGSKAAWVAEPSVSWLDNSGQKRWTRIVELPKELRESVQVAVLTAWTGGRADG